ncbi:hypothetical protein HELRODRAFT_64757 [Helobdella robusta]|uniref:VPS9 domain-containing protein n=1 Tax=Helobdella robusta TaxID=6412 RepID=T1FXY6_HELRO|nr:hypothetical protein HELRODRAFT_64757 [Helobdella robusta]ESO06287.1 hypothetical protein HELRODRAFT_64757 [Helobdella robusta]
MKKDETADNELMIFLKYLLSEALVVGDKILATQLQATIKCLSNFRHYDLKRVLNSLRADYKLRSCYVAYLTRCKRSLLAFNHKYEKLLAELTRDQEMLNKYMISMMTRLFLEKHQRVLLKFVVDFQSLVLFDEKSDLLERFLTAKHAAMRQDVMWKDATEPQLQEARLCMERMIMSHIYLYAMYPNGDGDTSRDRLLEEHMQKLSAVITPDHRDLRIPSIYQNECPWLAAQKELIMINAFKTPEDKLGCVARCCSTIMTLLSLSLTCNTANHSAVPVADDLVPVLLYVIIQSGTPNLLSTIQYIESYCCKNNDSASFAADGCYKNAKIDGEVWYWWTQFVAAVNFIKSMDYKE